MAWFKRKTAGIQTKISEQINVPEGHWMKCPECSTTINQREIEKNVKVCPNCSHHFKLSSIEYFELLFDNGQFQVYDDTLISVDPLEFVDKKPYATRLEDSREKTQLSDAARAAMGMIGGHRVSVASTRSCRPSRPASACLIPSRPSSRVRPVLSRSFWSWTTSIGPTSRLSCCFNSWLSSSLMVAYW